MRRGMQGPSACIGPGRAPPGLQGCCALFSGVDPESLLRRQSLQLFLPAFKAKQHSMTTLIPELAAHVERLD